MNEILIKSIVDKYLMDNVPSGKLIDDIDYEDGEINILYTNGDADFFEIDIPTPKDGKNGKDGKDGKDYVLTQQDKEQIAREIVVPIVEKVIEKTEIIKEVPIITNEIKEVAKYETPKEIVKKIESLEGQERLSAKAIKGLEEFMVEGQRAGASSLTALTDTNIINPTTGQTLVYNQGRSQRENKDGGTGGGIESVVAGTGIVVDNTDTANPIVSIDPDLLTSSVVFYATTTASDISGYTKLVTSIEDPDYDEPAVNIPTGPITGADQLVGELATVPGLFVGNPGIITITTIGEIRKTVGGSSHNAQFYFKVFHRTSAGVETEIAVSNTTLPITTATYSQFNTSAILNNGAFDATDRVVIKYYGTKIGSGADPEYEFMFGGSNPIRTLFPVPTDILLTNYYTKTETDTLLDNKRDLYTREYLVMNWSATPTVNTTITGGTVYNYTLGATTRYRFVPTTYNPTQDAFYGAFDGTDLTSLITTRG